MVVTNAQLHSTETFLLNYHLTKPELRLSVDSNLGCSKSVDRVTQQPFTCSNSTIETLETGEKYVQS